MAIHVDAFRMITYRAEDNSSTELVWNSRDGAAPTTIVLRDGRSARRVDVREPVLPHHHPSVGHMVLIDCTEEWASQRADELASRLWADAGDELGYASRDVLEADLLLLFQVNVAARYARAVVVTEELVAQEGWVVPV